MSKAIFEQWERHAEWWQREFTDGADDEYVEQLIPLIVKHLPDDGCVVDIGCGEGQVAREIVKQGLSAVGVDSSVAQLAAAMERGQRNTVEEDRWGSDFPLRYIRGSATSLPLANGSMASAVMCLVVEHIPDLQLALNEAARVVAPGGSLIVLMNHPLVQAPQSGWVNDQIMDPPEQYWRIGPYLSEQVTLELVDLDVALEFHHRPLSSYINSAFDAGFALEWLDEPAPALSYLSHREAFESAKLIPRIAVMRFRRFEAKHER